MSPMRWQLSVGPCPDNSNIRPTRLITITIANDGSGDNHLFHLYVREKDAKAELWDGARSGTQAATDVFNADEVRRSCPLRNRA